MLGHKSFKALKVKNNILKIILCSTGSQCSSLSKGVTCSCLRLHKISRAAQFWANCNLWTKCFGRPYNRELQLSNLHVTKACTNALVLLTDKNFLIREIFRILTRGLGNFDRVISFHWMVNRLLSLSTNVYINVVTNVLTGCVFEELCIESQSGTRVHID